jgi:hypothetical protein
MPLPLSIPPHDYTPEIIAVIEAMSSGATRIQYEGKSVEYGTRADLLARLRWLIALQNGGISGTNQCGFASFDRGDY